MNSEKKVAIIGGGNIGLAIADGLINSDLFPAENIYITRKRIDLIKEYSDKGFIVTKDNLHAVKNSDVILVAVQPGQLNDLLQELSSVLDEKKHILIVDDEAFIRENLERILNFTIIPCSMGIYAIILST